MRFGRHPKHFSVRIKDFLYCARAQFLRPFLRVLCHRCTLYMRTYLVWRHSLRVNNGWRGGGGGGEGFSHPTPEGRTRGEEKEGREKEGRDGSTPGVGGMCMG